MPIGDSFSNAAQRAVLRAGAQIRVGIEFEIEKRAIDTMRDMRDQLLLNMTTRARQFAAELQATMQENAPWEDNNLNRQFAKHGYGELARSGIYAQATRSGDVLTLAAGYRDSVYHDYGPNHYTYGGILETWDPKTKQVVTDGGPWSTVLPHMNSAYDEWPQILEEAFVKIGSKGVKRPKRGQR